MAYKDCLTAQRIRELLHYDPLTGNFTWIQKRRKIAAGTPAGSIDKDGYLTIYIEGANYFGHRLAWVYTHGVWPNDQIDHKDRIKSNNKILNLREATNKQNHENIPHHKNNTSGHRGVYWYKPYGKWMAMINHNSQQIFLGYFSEKSDAINSRITAENKYFTHAVSQVTL